MTPRLPPLQEAGVRPPAASRQGRCPIIPPPTLPSAPATPMFATRRSGKMRSGVCSAENVVEDYSREMAGQLVSRSIPGQQVLRLLDQPGDTHSLPPMIVCNNGPGFTRKAMFPWAKECNTKPGFIQPGKPTQNAFVQNPNGKFRNECLNPHGFRSPEEAPWEIEQWRKHHNHVWPRSAPGYLPPVEFAKQAA